MGWKTIYYQIIKECDLANRFPFCNYDYDFNRLQFGDNNSIYGREHLCNYRGERNTQKSELLVSGYFDCCPIEEAGNVIKMVNFRSRVLDNYYSYYYKKFKTLQEKYNTNWFIMGDTNRWYNLSDACDLQESFGFRSSDSYLNEYCSGLYTKKFIVPVIQPEFNILKQKLIEYSTNDDCMAECDQAFYQTIAKHFWEITEDYTFDLEIFNESTN
ncbi:MAG: hypothetical protein JKX76_01880 [Colwellia sp.]|nr:hypothetical protein [Colwellia sp.]